MKKEIKPQDDTSIAEILFRMAGAAIIVYIFILVISGVFGETPFDKFNRDREEAAEKLEKKRVVYEDDFKVRCQVAFGDLATSTPAGCRGEGWIIFSKYSSWADGRVPFQENILDDGESPEELRNLAKKDLNDSIVARAVVMTIREREQEYCKKLLASPTTSASKKDYLDCKESVGKYPRNIADIKSEIKEYQAEIKRIEALPEIVEIGCSWYSLMERPKEKISIMRCEDPFVAPELPTSTKWK